MGSARVELPGISDIANGKKAGLISITTSNKGPKFAAGLVNAYVDELIKITKTMAISEASQRRRFFEQQLMDTKDQLADAGIALRTTWEKTGVVQSDNRVRAIISTIAQLKGTITAKKVQLNAMRTFATERNPELLRTQEELRGLQVQLVGHLATGYAFCRADERSVIRRMVQTHAAEGARSARPRFSALPLFQ